MFALHIQNKYYCDTAVFYVLKLSVRLLTILDQLKRFVSTKKKADNDKQSTKERKVQLNQMIIMYSVVKLNPALNKRKPRHVLCQC